MKRRFLKKVIQGPEHEAILRFEFPFTYLCHELGPVHKQRAGSVKRASLPRRDLSCIVMTTEKLLVFTCSKKERMPSIDRITTMNCSCMQDCPRHCVLLKFQVEKVIKISLS